VYLWRRTLENWNDLSNADQQNKRILVVVAKLRYETLGQVQCGARQGRQPQATGRKQGVYVSALQKGNGEGSGHVHAASAARPLPSAGCCCSCAAARAPCDPDRLLPPFSALAVPPAGRPLARLPRPPLSAACYGPRSPTSLAVQVYAAAQAALLF
jgi:hypothetical protein